MKKIFCLFLSLMLCFVSVYAEESKSETYTLTLKEAIDMGLKDNPKLLSIEITKHSNEINLDAANINKLTYKEAIISTAAYEVAYIQKGYYADMYKMLIGLNELEAEQVKRKIAYDVTESYYNLKLSESLCKVTEDAYNLAKSNLSDVTKRYELGMIAKLDLENAKLSVEAVKNTLDTYKRNYELAKENFKINISLDGKDCEFELPDSIEVSEFEVNADEDIKKALETRYDVTALKENYRMAQLYFNYTKALTPNSAKYQTAYSDLITKEYNYTHNKKLIALSMKSCYYNALNAKDSLSTAITSADIAKQRYDIAKLRFENGMITNSELTGALNDYLSENIKLENAKLTYKMATEKYYAETTIGL